MICLSIQQPWAWAICHAGKDIENRSWSTSFRGKFLIHSGKKFDQEGYYYLTRKYPEINWPKPSEFEKGGIVGSAEVVDCVSHHTSKWFFGTYGFVLHNAVSLPFKECKGRLGFFNV